MPRYNRVAVPDFPHHLIQRGHDRELVFHEEADFRAYLDTLAEFRRELSLRVCAYCLMTNHVHLIVDPGDDPKRLGQLMRRLAGRHTRRINRMQKRTGTAWDGRYKCSPIETDTYLLVCSRYVEMNPVRAGLAAQPEGYLWSSYRAKVGLAITELLDPDPCYLALSPDAARRQQAYREFVLQESETEETEFLRQSVRRNQLTGSAQFAAKVAKHLHRPMINRPPGRPRKEK